MSCFLLQKHKVYTLPSRALWTGGRRAPKFVPNLRTVRNFNASSEIFGPLILEKTKISSVMRKSLNFVAMTSLVVNIGFCSQSQCILLINPF